MIKETDGDRFETMRCLNQNLTFEATKKEFELRKTDFGSQQMRTLKLVDQDGLYSNLALLLSDQCVHTVKVAAFQGTDQTIFKDRREFAGSLMQQMNEIYDFIDFRNQTHATIEKLYRVDVRDYPEIAVREALLNLLVHRDYSFSASAFISIYADRIEFVSIGGLLPMLEVKSGTPFTTISKKKISDEEEKILEYTRIHGVITKNNAMELLEVSASTASRVIRKMVKNNLLKQNGKARNTHYTIADK